MSSLSVESELLSKLENIFGFQYVKGKKFQDLASRDFLDVYKIFFRTYDSAWLLDDEKSTSTILRKIQSFLQRMELGHLILKGEDLLDPKKNCRLLGAIVSKLESRHNGVQNILAAVRKIRLLKPKTASERNLQKKENSSGSAAEEEPTIPALIVPHKGRELPRTPPSRSGSCPDSDDNKTNSLRTNLARSPLAVPQKTYVNQPVIAITKKGFRPILPTKEIPRTPLKGVARPPVDILHLTYNNPNLTVDFSASHLTSSNTSTPYTSRSSGKSGDATFVVSPKRSDNLIENDSKSEKKQHKNSAIEDSVFENEVMTGTFVAKTEGEIVTQTKPAFDDSWTLEMEENNDKLEDQKLTSPGANKNPGKEPKTKVAKPDLPAKMKNDEEKTESPLENDQAVSNPAAAETVVIAPRGKKGKKKIGGKKDVSEDLVVQEPAIADPAPEVELEAPAPIEAELKKGRGKKTGKKEMTEENAVEVPVATASELPAETESEAPAIAEPKGKKGRAKKAQATSKTEESNPSPVTDSDPVPPTVTGAEQEKMAKPSEPTKVEAEAADNEVQNKKARAKKGNKESVKDTAVVEKPAAEQKEEISATAVEMPVEMAANSVEPKGKKGRGKKNNQSAESAQPVAEADPQAEANAEPVSDVKEKKGRKATKQQTEDVQNNDETNGAAQLSEVPVAEVKEKRGRGRPKAVAEDPKDKETILKEESSPVQSEVAEPKEKKGRGRAAKESADKNKPAGDEAKETESLPVAEVKEKKGRGRAAKTEVAVTTDEVETNEVAIPEAAPSKKGRGKKAAKAVEEPEAETEAVDEQKDALKSKGGKKGGQPQIDAEEETVEEPGKKAPKRGRNQVTVAQDEANSPKKSKDDTIDHEGPRKSSRNKGEPVKTYDESESSPKSKRGRKKADAKTSPEVVDEKKSKNKKKNAEAAETEPEPPKIATKRNNKKTNLEEAKEAKEAEPLIDEKKRGGKKAAVKSSELNLQSTSGDDEKTAPSPPKKSKNDGQVTEEPEKKTRGRKKKEDPPPAVDNEEVEKKKPGRKKVAAVAEEEKEEEEEETETGAAVASPVQSKQRGRRAAVQPTSDDGHVFVAYIAGQESTEPSPTGPPPPKSRRLKLVEETSTAQQDDEASAPAVKRSNRNRK